MRFLQGWISVGEAPAGRKQTHFPWAPKKLPARMGGQSENGAASGRVLPLAGFLEETTTSSRKSLSGKILLKHEMGPPVL